MFNLNMAPPAGTLPSRGRPAHALFGKALGFVAGLVLIAAIDALLWHHALWRSVAERIAPGDPTLLHAVGRLGRTLLGP